MAIITWRRSFRATSLKTQIYFENECNPGKWLWIIYLQIYAKKLIAINYMTAWTNYKTNYRDTVSDDSHNLISKILILINNIKLFMYLKLFVNTINLNNIFSLVNTV